MNMTYDEGDMDFDELREKYDETVLQRDAARTQVYDLTKKNQQLTMDLIMISAMIGTDQTMVSVQNRLMELLDRESAYKALMNIG